ncbi:hypothetical protein SteCoe_36814 [Stentor coeruleus]|uniref:Uncharacterized protein n=1 Tax=Stentor coeruleus TaxID=5963 RepID=A0A1R2APE9_9CILI|nr:hypothetical protein SteCoe_36814 [Stentor coeruleus]
MVNMVICLVSLAFYKIAFSSIELPSDVIVPKISGIRTISVEKSDGLYFYMFSGSIDASRFSSNMMIKSPKSIRFSNTFYYPPDRSYYGMAYFEDPTNNNKLVIIFGGIGLDGVYGDIWAYNIDMDIWKKFDFELPEPCYDFAYTSFIDPITNKTIIVISGGLNNMNTYVNKAYKCIIEDKYCELIKSLEDCFDYGIVGAELLYIDDYLLLFSGYYYYRSNESDNIVINRAICQINLIENSIHLILTDSTGAFNGGSCYYNNSIYSFFGFTYYDYIKKIESIYITDIIDFIPTKISIKCPKDLECARGSFAISCNENNVTILGGISKSGPTNSYFTIDLDILEVVDYKEELNYPSPRAFASLS